MDGKQYKLMSGSYLGGYGLPFDSKIAANLDGDDETTGVYLFDLTADPYEMTNLWNSEAHIELKMSMLDSLCESYGTMEESVFVKDFNADLFWTAVNATKAGNDPFDTREFGYATHWYPADGSYEPLPTYLRADFEEAVGMTPDKCPFDALRAKTAEGTPLEITRAAATGWGAPFRRVSGNVTSDLLKFTEFS